MKDVSPSDSRGVWALLCLGGGFCWLWESQEEALGPSVWGKEVVQNSVSAGPSGVVCLVMCVTFPRGMEQTSFLSLFLQKLAKRLKKEKAMLDIINFGKR